MGRELKRVPLDFEWPLHQIWIGYWWPFDAMKCFECKGAGSSARARELQNDPSCQRRDEVFRMERFDWAKVEEKCAEEGVSSRCPRCGGEGQLWPSPEIKEQSEAWEKIDPPEGPGWQVWETVSEGSPVTPVFATSEALVEHLVASGESSRDAAEAFVRHGWVPSAIIKDGVMYANYEAASLHDDNG